MAAAAVLVCALPSVAAAQGTSASSPRARTTTTVRAPTVDCTLREAITLDTATEIQLPHDRYSLEPDDPLVISRPLTIRGGIDDDELATIAANVRDPGSRHHDRARDRVRLFRLRIEGGNEEDLPGGGVDDGLGGGLYVPASSSLVVTDSEIVNNRAVSGGGIWSAGPLTLVRTTVADNAAVGVGAGRRSRRRRRPRGHVGAGDVHEHDLQRQRRRQPRRRHLHATIDAAARTSRSSATSRRAPSPGQNGAGLYQQFAPGSGSVTTARNTLLALNTNGGCGGTADPFPLDSNNGLLDELDRVTGPSCNADLGDNTLVNAGTAGVVATLAGNDGLTRTHELADNSPAIGAGVDCPADDQRGFPRPFDIECDIGAYEFGAENLTPDVSVFTDETTQPGCTVDHCTLRERIDAADGDDLIMLGAGTYELTSGEAAGARATCSRSTAPARAPTTIDANGTSRVGFVDGDDLRDDRGRHDHRR